MLKAIILLEENILNSSIYVCIYKIKFKVWKQDRTDLIKIHFQPKKKKKKNSVTEFLWTVKILLDLL